MPCPLPPLLLHEGEHAGIYSIDEHQVAKIGKNLNHEIIVLMELQRQLTYHPFISSIKIANIHALIIPKMIPIVDLDLNTEQWEKCAKSLILELYQLHSINICHYDIKPEHIVVTPDKSKAYFIDYSMSNFTHITINDACTDGYRPPEAYMAMPSDDEWETHFPMHTKDDICRTIPTNLISPYADVYSLGITLLQIGNGLYNKDQEHLLRLMCNPNISKRPNIGYLVLSLPFYF